MSSIISAAGDTIGTALMTDKISHFRSAYGRDMIPKRKFSDLLRTVGCIRGLERLRFVTSHPRYMSLGVVDAVAETPAVCENFHIPFQSGSNEILASMGRGHTREKYLRIVDRIRSVSIKGLKVEFAASNGML